MQSQKLKSTQLSVTTFPFIHEQRNFKKILLLLWGSVGKSNTNCAVLSSDGEGRKKWRHFFYLRHWSHTNICLPSLFLITHFALISGRSLRDKKYSFFLFLIFSVVWTTKKNISKCSIILTSITAHDEHDCYSTKLKNWSLLSFSKCCCYTNNKQQQQQLHICTSHLLVFITSVLSLSHSHFINFSSTIELLDDEFSLFFSENSFFTAG